MGLTQSTLRAYCTLVKALSREKTCIVQSRFSQNNLGISLRVPYCQSANSGY
jgi:hypothetical protein